ncbi:hypothetical protein EAG_06842 [Camponotus floridanus]|uniref:Uncharacterized protein n=1 Tax=Camponotus floridanus TaxID=104421 RepID=E2A1I5_CAMFO|nr:hypothetical protein EAG_06842 [Camponotus floridanus]
MIIISRAPAIAVICCVLPFPNANLRFGGRCNVLHDTVAILEMQLVNSCFASGNEGPARRQEKTEFYGRIAAAMSGGNRTGCADEALNGIFVYRCRENQKRAFKLEKVLKVIPSARAKVSAASIICWDREIVRYNPLCDKVSVSPFHFSSVVLIYSPTSFANGRPFALQQSEWVSWIKKAPPMFASSGDDVDEDDDGRPRDGLPQLVIVSHVCALSANFVGVTFPTFDTANPREIPRVHVDVYAQRRT